MTNSPLKQTERNLHIVELLADYTMAEVGRMYKLSHERIRQIAREYGYKGANRVRHGNRMIERNSKLGRVVDRVLAEELDVPLSAVAWARYRTGKRSAWKKDADRIGCPKCETEPYARGLCKPCYNRANRRGLLAGRLYTHKGSGRFPPKE